jgi:hypothetical protein
MPAKQPTSPREPIPFDDVLRRLLAAPPAPKVATKRKPKAHKRVAKPRK